jgi:hypothetical protein
LRRRKLPNPRSSIFSPRLRASMMLSNTVSTMTSECFLVRSIRARLLRLVPPSSYVSKFRNPKSEFRDLFVLQVIAERRAAVTL